MITDKELLSEVLGIPEVLDEVLVIDNHIIYRKYNELGFKFNIYEASHKYKEWVSDFNQLQGLCSHKVFYIQTDGSRWYCGFAKLHSTYDNNAELEDIVAADTEPEAVIKACELIKEQLKEDK